MSRLSKKSPVAGIDVQYIYSACLVTTTPDVRILHDPWFTDGAFDGAWCQFPKVANPISLIGDCDYIYISHIHPDHYDPVFLRKYFKKYGEKQILIADFPHNYLAKRLATDGFAFQILKKPLKIGRTRLRIYPFSTGSLLDIDSFVILEFNDGKKMHRIVNLNDCNFNMDSPQSAQLKNVSVDILLACYTDASSYPQCYFDLDDPMLKIERARRIKNYIGSFVRIAEQINPRCVIPFAGQYVLGGRLAGLNRYRGVSDAIDARDAVKNGLVLETGASIDTVHLTATKERTKRYSAAQLSKRLAVIKKMPMPYDGFVADEHLERIPFLRLLAAASRNALSKSEVEFDYFYRITAGDISFEINANRSKSVFGRPVSGGKRLPEPRTEITLPKALLLGLLMGRFNWNNMLVGSHLKIRRFPNYVALKKTCPYSADTNRKIADFLNFLAV